MGKRGNTITAFEDPSPKKRGRSRSNENFGVLGIFDVLTTRSKAVPLFNTAIKTQCGQVRYGFLSPSKILIFGASNSGLIVRGHFTSFPRSQIIIQARTKTSETPYTIHLTIYGPCQRLDAPPLLYCDSRHYSATRLIYICSPSA